MVNDAPAEPCWPSPPERLPRADPPLVSIVIPVWNQWSFTARCLAALHAHTREVPVEVIVVDNGSTDGSAAHLARIEGVQVLRNPENRGFAKACNQGAAAARGRFVLFLNNDTEPLPGWLPPLVEALERNPRLAAAGSKLLFPNGTLQHAGVELHYASPHPITPVHILRGERPGRARGLDPQLWVTGACMLLRRDVFADLGGFDEGYLNSYEDVDLCFKITQAGMGVAFVADSVLIHYESMTPGRHDHEDANRARLHQRWLRGYWDLTRAHRPPHLLPQGPPGPSPLAVVVACQDALKDIAGCLEALAAQLGPGDQLLLADGGSRDGTLTFLSVFAADFPGIASVVQGQQGPNQAARTALWSARMPSAVVLPATLRPPQDFFALVRPQLLPAGDQVRASELGGGQRVLLGRTAILRQLSPLEVLPWPHPGSG